MSKPAYEMSPDEINLDLNRVVYRCRACGVGTGLHWFHGTSCPACSRPECVQKLEAEWKAAYEEIRTEDDC